MLTSSEHAKGCADAVHRVQHHLVMSLHVLLPASASIALSRAPGVSINRAASDAVPGFRPPGEPGAAAHTTRRPPLTQPTASRSWLYR
jgi:hypothetical protein